ncbi:MAG: response regulator transcription factor [Luteibacter sp.]|uniref:response regulator transcription factor n=1 Tax=Luteibacter TaxID=242605 RepID=UPI000561D386|nr:MULTISPECIES: response regulator transcription factor [unclassified Luteibacter]MDQ7996306.1 response regulator transcription factor [Luteibacter sp.]MDQ8048066.1 response regulator transcription factor [Luteibacter sp.]MDR6642862.1 FixJ family two-component response regulator [Luteibacter sp. 1214]
MTRLPVANAARTPIVCIVDDDASIREALSSLFRSVGLTVATFGSAADFLARDNADAPGCLVLDVRLPGVSGLDFQTQLLAMENPLPIVFMTGYGDIPMSVRAMKAGALDFLAKPFRDQDMLDAVTNAIERDASGRRDADALHTLRQAYASLTPREREVMGHVTTGLMNKQVGALLGLSEITVKIHRGNVMRKMAARSLAELVKMSEALGAHTSV